MTKHRKGILVGALITIGVVYGDIGTSPLYVMNALIGNAGGMKYLTPDYVIGCLSLIFWTLMLITTIKYVLVALRADNNGEGGIFALYALVKNKAKWLILPALIGGAALLADGTLTPAVTVTSAIEGLKGVVFHHTVPVHDQNDVVIITLTILLVLFLIQRFGTSFIGRAFGPIMLVWFGFLAVFGIYNMHGNLGILKALSPVYGLRVLFSPVNKDGLFILGSIFLATTGAEALYSDMGHVGRRNIYITWPFVFLALILNYFGQGAYLIRHMSEFHHMSGAINPFYTMLPGKFYMFGVVIATLAAIIASQALITGSFTLVEEAEGLKLLPRMFVEHPSMSRGQIYIKDINWLLCIITCSVLLFFRTSEHMEAAYGLAITVTMLMTTVLLFNYLEGTIKKGGAVLFCGLYVVIETMFFIASMSKFIHGGYVTLFIMGMIIFVMVIWYYGNQVRKPIRNVSQKVSLKDYLGQLVKLANDNSVQRYTDNLVMISRVKNDYSIDRETLYSILDKHPKRARVYWFVTVNQTDKPFTNYYTVDMMGTRNVVNLQLYVGFKMRPRVNLYIRKVIHDLMDKGMIDEQPQTYTTTPGRRVGDFCFILIRELLPANVMIPNWKRFLISARIFLQNHLTNPVQWFGLEFSDVRVEKVPLFLKQRRDTTIHLREVKNTAEK